MDVMSAGDHARVLQLDAAPYVEDPGLSAAVDERTERLHRDRGDRFALPAGHMPGKHVAGEKTSNVAVPQAQEIPGNLCRVVGIVDKQDRLVMGEEPDGKARQPRRPDGERVREMRCAEGQRKLCVEDDRLAGQAGEISHGKGNGDGLVKCSALNAQVARTA